MATTTISAFTTPAQGFPFVVKDPDAVLDYKINWAPWLRDPAGGASDTITTAVFTVQAGLTKDSSLIAADGLSATVWLSGGQLGKEYTVNLRITTAGGRREDRTFVVKMQSR